MTLGGLHPRVRVDRLIHPLSPPSFMHSAFSSTVGVMLSYIELDLAHTKSYTQAESC